MGAEFENKVAVVTGGSAGIGEAVSRRFAAEGARVAILARTADRGEAVARSIRNAGGQASFFSCDVADQGSVVTAIGEVVDAFGGLSLLCNNAGSANLELFPDEPFEDWDRVLRVNLTGTYLVTQAAWPHLARAGHGAVVNISSMAAVNGFNGENLNRNNNLNASASYYAAKAGIEAFTRYTASIGSRDGIRVNCIRPGQILTESATGPDGRHVFASVLEPAQMIEGPGTPDDVADAVLFLSSDKARFITAAILNLDGGSSAKV